MLMGSSNAANKFKSELRINFNEKTIDNVFFLKEGECMGACVDAPVCLINDKKMIGLLNWTLILLN